MPLQEVSLEEIESLLNHSTRGIHALFDHQKVAEILRRPTEDLDFFSFSNLEKIQSLFARFLNCRTCLERQQFLLNLSEHEYETLVRMYFHLLENTVLAHSTYRH